MNSKYLDYLRKHQIKYQAYWQAKEYLQEIFKNRCKSDLFEDLEEILEFQNADFAREFQKEVLKNMKNVSEKLETSISKKIGKIN